MMGELREARSGMHNNINVWVFRYEKACSENNGLAVNSILLQSEKTTIQKRKECKLLVSAVSASSNPHYGSGKGATKYRFVSNQFSSFYTKVINTNARDAIHGLMGCFIMNLI